MWFNSLVGKINPERKNKMKATKNDADIRRTHPLCWAQHPLCWAQQLDFIMFSNDKRPYALICDPITYTKTGYVEAVIRRFCIVRRDFVGPRFLLGSDDNSWKFISDKKISSMMRAIESNDR